MAGSKKNITIKLGKKVYRAGAVKRTVKTYSDYADISVKDDGDFLTVKISGIPEEQVAEFKGEFCNYALFMMKNV